MKRTVDLRWTAALAEAGVWEHIRARHQTILANEELRRHDSDLVRDFHASAKEFPAAAFLAWRKRGTRGPKGDSPLLPNVATALEFGGCTARDLADAWDQARKELSTPLAGLERNEVMITAVRKQKSSQDYCLHS